MNENEYAHIIKQSFERFKHLSIEELIKEIAHYENEIARATLRLNALRTANVIKLIAKAAKGYEQKD